MLVSGLDEMTVVSSCPLLPIPWTVKAFWSKVIASIRLGESPELLVWALGFLGVPVSEVSSNSGFVPVPLLICQPSDCQYLHIPFLSVEIKKIRSY